MIASSKSPIFNAAGLPERSDPFDGIAVFMEVVQAGGFAKAAAQLGLTRSAVGKSIGRLETRLGTRLFHRTTRSQSLTEDGQVYHERCVLALAELQTADAQLDSNRDKVVGCLHVSMPVMFGRYCIAPILLKLAQQHPELELQLSFSDLKVDVLAEGFDLSIRTGSLGVESEGLRARKLLEYRKLVYASPNYLASRGTPQSIADLSVHSILHYRHADHIHTWQLPDATGNIVDVPLYSRLLLNDLEVLADAAVAGMGLAWLPEWLVRERVQNGELVVVLNDKPGATMACHALWPSTSNMPLRLRLAIDTLIEQLPRYLDQFPQSLVTL